MSTDYVQKAAKIVIFLVVASIITFGVVRFYQKEIPSDSDRVDAQKALNDLKLFKSQQFESRILATYNKTKIEILTKIKNQNRTLSTEIKTKINSTQTKILLQQSNSRNIGINIDKCVTKTLTELAKFQQQILEIYSRCFGDPFEETEEILNEIVTEVRNYLETVVDCASKSLFECDISRDFECYRYIVKRIGGIVKQIPEILKKYQTVLMNLGEGFNMPCESLIDINLSLYPKVLLDYVTSCAKLKTLEMTNDVC